MRKFSLIVYSIVFLSLQAFSDNPTPGIVSSDAIKTQNEIKQQERKIRNALWGVIRECSKPGSKYTTTLEDGTEADCNNYVALAEEYNISTQPSKDCAESFKDYKSDLKDDKKTIADLQKEKTTAANEAEKENLEIQRAINEANEEYQTANKEYQDALNQLEESVDGEARQKMEELQNTLLLLQTEINKRSDLVSQLENAYDQCKATSEAEFPKQIGQIQEFNRKQRANNGKNIVVNRNKLKKQLTEYHAKCVANAYKKYQADLKSSETTETSLNSKIQNLQRQISKLTNEDYQKKLTSLQQALVIAQQKSQAETQRLNQDLQRVSKNYQQKIRDIDAEIFSMAANGEKYSKNTETPSFFSSCCANGQLKSGIIPGYSGVPDSRQCRTSKSKPSTRNQGQEYKSPLTPKGD